VNNSLAIENTRLIKLYTDIDDRVRPLAILIKYWAKSRVLNDAAGGGTLTSYTWILMVINFLQTRNPPILPSLQKLPHPARYSNGIDVGYFDDISALKDFGSQNKETLGGLLYAFFVKFAFEFDYDNEVISVRTGGILPKSCKSDWLKEHNKSLCVEEPFNTSRNLGNTADDATVKGLRLEFRRAVHYLADHTSLELACWPYTFPSAEVPRPERHLPNLPPQYRAGYRGRKYPQSRQNGTSPPFKSPKTRAQDVRYQGFNRQYGFGLTPLVTVPQSQQQTGEANFPPTPVEQTHYLDPFKNPKTYYVPAFSPNGFPVYVPYSEDSIIYASPPQTPAMSDPPNTYPRTPHPVQNAYPPPASVRPPAQQDAQQPPQIISPPYIPPPIKRRNSLPANNKPNGPVRVTSTIPSSEVKTTGGDSSEYTTPSSGTSAVGEQSMSSVGSDDEEGYFTPRGCSLEKKGELGKSYAAAVLQSPGRNQVLEKKGSKVPPTINLELTTTVGTSPVEKKTPVTPSWKSLQPEKSPTSARRGSILSIGSTTSKKSPRLPDSRKPSIIPASDPPIQKKSRKSKNRKKKTNNKEKSTERRLSVVV
jgi:Cid1 family poly A polymerase